MARPGGPPARRPPSVKGTRDKVKRRSRDLVDLRAVGHEKLRGEHERARLKTNNSPECRNRHDFGYMDLTRQSQRAPSAHEKFPVSGEKTCIDRQQDAAHEIPDMTGVPGWR